MIFVEWEDHQPTQLDWPLPVENPEIDHVQWLLDQAVNVIVLCSQSTWLKYLCEG